MPTPGDGITYREAARILGAGMRTVQRMAERGELTLSGPPNARRRSSRAQVEALALLLPFEVTASGVRVFLQDQLRAVSNARLSRRLG